MAKKFEAAVYYMKEAGPRGAIMKRGSRQVCEQYVREQSAKSKIVDGFPYFEIITDAKDTRLNHRK